MKKREETQLIVLEKGLKLRIGEVGVQFIVEFDDFGKRVVHSWFIPRNYLRTLTRIFGTKAEEIVHR